MSQFSRDEIWRLDPATGQAVKVGDVPGGVDGTLSGLEYNRRDGW